MIKWELLMLPLINSDCALLASGVLPFSYNTIASLGYGIINAPQVGPVDPLTSTKFTLYISNTILLAVQPLLHHYLSVLFMFMFKVVTHWQDTLDETRSRCRRRSWRSRLITKLPCKSLKVGQLDRSSHGGPDRTWP